MNKTRVQVEVTIEFSMEVMVPMGSNGDQIDRIVKQEVDKEVGNFAVDATFNVVDIEEDVG